MRERKREIERKEVQAEMQSGEDKQESSEKTRNKGPVGIGVDKLPNQNENLLILSFFLRSAFSCILAFCIQEIATFHYFVCLNASISNANASIESCAPFII